MKKIAVSIHDVTPKFGSELERIFGSLDQMGVTIRSELAVPDYGRRCRLDEHLEFAAILQEHRTRGCDISLHGIYHEYAEFFRFNQTAARDALSRGSEIFQRALGFAPFGFVAPQWLQSRGSLRAVREAGFGYTATLTGLYCRNGRRFLAFPVNYDWGLGLVDRFFCSCNGLKCRCRHSGLIRFSLHPMDVRHGMIDTELDHLRLLLDHGWEPTSYAGISSEATND